MSPPRIEKIEFATMEARRPRPAGKNARLDDHGIVVRTPIVRITDSDGLTGFGFGRLSPDEANATVGKRTDSLRAPKASDPPLPRGVEFAQWDLAGKQNAVPCYALAAGETHAFEPDVPLRVPCYDTSLYFDDLHITETHLAADLIANEAKDGLAKGHRAFKIKVGRGAMHMPTTDGMERDIAVIRAVREAVGPDCRLMIDANNGYNLNLATQVIEQTRECSLFWIEEPFHEDPVLLRELKRRLEQLGLPVLIADGEGDASPHLIAWAKSGWVDVVQYDIFAFGFGAWLQLGRELDLASVRSAPHHYGALLGNYVSCHLAPGVQGFTFAEWDEADAPWLDASAYRLEDGCVVVPDLPGFGLTLDEDRFLQAVKENGGAT